MKSFGGVGWSCLNPNLVLALSQTLVWAKVEVWVKLYTNKKYNKKSKNKFSLDELKAYELSLIQLFNSCRQSVNFWKTFLPYFFLNFTKPGCSYISLVLVLIELLWEPNLTVEWQLLVKNYSTFEQSFVLC